MKRETRQDVIDGLSGFFSRGVRDAAACSGDPQEKALCLFHEVARTVPAYSRFLAEQGVRPEDISCAADFERIPCATKENYLRRHPLPDLCRDGAIGSSDMIAVSSGSTGGPFFWPRFLKDELLVAERFEQLFCNSFQADTKSTLAVICFTLGTWVGGLYTLSCCRQLAWKGYPITSVAPGSNIAEILRVVRELARHFEQTVLLGYPPFLKLVIDEGAAAGVPWKACNIRLVTAGEVFSEEWRDLMATRIGSTRPCFDFASLYGTADAGVLANETPLSISIRRFLGKNPGAARDLFGESRLPTLAQYDPFSRFFEVRNSSLLFTGDNGIPLVRYGILDNGGLVTFDQMMAFLSQRGFDPLEDLRSEAHCAQQPFVYVFGRSDFTISYFGANIYPEQIQPALEQPGIADWVTGKFVMQVMPNQDQESILSIVVEMAYGAERDSRKQRRIEEEILLHLLRNNSEFANYVPPASQAPEVRLAPHGDPEYFAAAGKHRYSRR
ncbi:MAG TPA: hypothetical protein VGS41_16660 [Chthonomonadales bacterium]|nr:hypothetical protein [Chthonomonadales bacterium]